MHCAKVRYRLFVAAVKADRMSMPRTVNNLQALRSDLSLHEGLLWASETPLVSDDQNDLLKRFRSKVGLTEQIFKEELETATKRRAQYINENGFLSRAAQLLVGELQSILCGILISARIKNTPKIDENLLPEVSLMFMGAVCLSIIIKTIIRPELPRYIFDRYRNYVNDTLNSLRKHIGTYLH